MLVVLSLTQVSAATGWAVQAISAPTAQNGRMAAVSCTAAPACESVGYSISSTGSQQSLAEEWSAAGWKAQRVAEPPQDALSFLDGISCVASSTCMAVGGYAKLPNTIIPHTLPLTERWNGKAFGRLGEGRLSPLTRRRCSWHANGAGSSPSANGCRPPALSRTRPGLMPPRHDETLWELDAHSRGKHRILRSYMDAWFPIMTRHNRRVVVVDGFAGPGRYTNGEPGSPLILLDAYLDHAYRMHMTSEIV